MSANICIYISLNFQASSQHQRPPPSPLRTRCRLFTPPSPLPSPQPSLSIACCRHFAKLFNQTSCNYSSHNESRRIRRRPRRPRCSRPSSPAPPPSLTPPPKGMAAPNPFQKLTTKIIQALQITRLRPFFFLHFPTLFPNGSPWATKKEKWKFPITTTEHITHKHKTGNVSTKNGYRDCV